eukprot:1161200-Pelagomonas_calceolata.AAC.16
MQYLTPISIPRDVAKALSSAIPESLCLLMQHLHGTAEGDPQIFGKLAELSTACTGVSQTFASHLKAFVIGTFQISEPEVL